MAIFKKRQPKPAQPPADAPAPPMEFNPERPWLTHATPISDDLGDRFAIAHHGALAAGDWRAAREALLAAPRASRTWVAAAKP